MDTLHGLLLGFSGALMPNNLFACFLGVTWGTLIGVLPGIGFIGGIVLLLPLTYQMEITGAMVMMAGIFYGAMYGGAITSILINLPGDPPSVVSCLEGYPLARKGRAGPALAMQAIASFVGGTASVIALSLIAPPLVSVSLRFGPPEFFALMFFGLSMVAYLSGQSVLKGLMMTVFGLMLGTVGIDIITGTHRFYFGQHELLGGIDLVPVAIGLFGIGEILITLESKQKREVIQPNLFDLRALMPSREEFRRAAPAVLRGSIIGFFVGILPGAAATVSTFMAYAVEKRVSKHPELFGTGEIEGLAAPEAANNAATGGAMVPLLALGMPYSPVTALMLNAMVAQGIQPSPLLMHNQPDFFWTVVASMYVGNIMLLVLNLPLVGVWAGLLKVPLHYFFPVILLLCITGVYSSNYNLLDLQIMILFGIIGYFMKKSDYPGAPLLLGLVLGPMFENALGQSMIISSGDPSILISRPISGTIIMIALFLLIWPGIRWIMEKRKSAEIPEKQN
jgi:putative tricarboxylic transport membrane protein